MKRIERPVEIGDRLAFFEVDSHTFPVPSGLSHSLPLRPRQCPLCSHTNVRASVRVYLNIDYLDKLPDWITSPAHCAVNDSDGKLHREYIPFMQTRLGVPLTLSRGIGEVRDEVYRIREGLLGLQHLFHLSARSHCCVVFPLKLRVRLATQDPNAARNCGDG
jgi:hypothetical protein